MSKLLTAFAVSLTLSACSFIRPAPLECSAATDVALDLFKTQLAKSLRRTHGDKVANVAVDQTFEIRNITPIAREVDVPSVTCAASVFGWELMDEPEVDEATGRTWWELDKSGEPDEISRISYSVHTVEDDETAAWVTLIST